MNTHLNRRTIRRGFTLIELLVVVAIIGILAALLLPTLSRGKLQAQRAQCTSQLRQVGAAFHMFAHDHNNRFPMEVPAALGGSLEYAAGANTNIGEFYFSFRHFLPIALELTTPKVLLCPTDKRTTANDFAHFDNRNLSYFVALNSRMDSPDTILAGDRNLTNDWHGGRSIVEVNAEPLRWTREMHQFMGNLLFADGHVVFSGQSAIRPNQVQKIADALLPSVQREFGGIGFSGSASPRAQNQNSPFPKSSIPDSGAQGGKPDYAGAKNPSSNEGEIGLSSGKFTGFDGGSSGDPKSKSNSVKKSDSPFSKTATNALVDAGVTNAAIWTFGMAESAKFPKDSGIYFLLGLFALILLIAFARKFQRSRVLRRRFR